MPRRALLLAGIAALTAVPVNASVNDFRLPAGPTPTPTWRAEGPIDPDLPRPVTAPSPTPAPTPTPRATAAPRPAPAAGATTGPVVQPIPSRPSPTPRPAPSRPVQPSPTPTPAPASAVPAPTVGTAVESPPLAEFTPTPRPAAAPVPAGTADTDDGWPWGWIGALAVFLALATGAGLWLRRRFGTPRGTVLIVPEIEKPRVPGKSPGPASEPAPADLPQPTFAAPGDVQPAPTDLPQGAPVPGTGADVAEHPLHILIQPARLTQTVMNVTLGYRLELTNRGSAPLTDLVVAADLVSAHASLPREALLAGPDSALPEKHRVASLAPGEMIELKGELRLAQASIVPIRQGQAVILVPLARFRASPDGEDSRCFTVVVGQPAASGAIQPFRLDLGLRSLEGLTGRAF